MARNIDIALIRTFVAVADHAGMTAAGNALHLTQSAVSQHIGRLEEFLDTELFVRERRSIRLSAAGERLLGKARRMLALNDEIWAAMTADRMDGQVRFGVPYDLAGTLIPPILKAYAGACPQVEVSLVCATSPELTAALTRGAIDLALIEEPAGQSRGECLAIERLVWVGARGGSAHLRRPLPVSMVADTCAFRPAVLAALADHGRDWRTMFENGSLDATSAMVRTDLAITTLLASTVPADLDILPPELGLPALPSFTINLHLPQRDTAPAVAELARLIRNGFTRQRQAA
jgi:DNA-binding transcriptional LysR family regulator